MLSQKSLKTNAILNVVKTLMGMLFPLITFPYASRVLEPDGVGKVNFITSIIVYFTLIALFGANNYGVRECAKLRDDKPALSQFFFEVLTINLFSTIVSFTLLFSITFTNHAFDGYHDLIIVCCAPILFTVVGVDWLYVAEEDYFYLSIRTIAFQILSLILLFVLVQKKEDYLWYAAIASISSTGYNLINFIHSKKYVNIHLVKKLKLKKHFQPLLIFFATAVAICINTSMDTVMLGIFGADRNVGIYTTASKMYNIVLTLVISVSAVVMPRLSYYSQKEDKTDFISLANKNMEILFLLSIPAILGLTLLAKSTICTVAGEDYVDAIPIMQILNPLILILGIKNFLGLQILSPLGKEKSMLLMYCIGALLNVVLNSLLVPTYMEYGAAISTLISEIATCVLMLTQATDVISIKQNGKKFCMYLVTTIPMSIIVWSCTHFYQNIYLQLVIGIVCGGITYFATLMVAKNTLLLSIIKPYLSKILTRNGK